MYLQVVFCVLFIQNVFGSPLVEMDEDPDWLPRYSRDFEIFDSDHWYKWWYGGKRKSTVQERIQTVETRQKVLFDLVLCESHNRIRTFVTDECELFRKKAEQVFGVPAKGAPTTTASPIPVTVTGVPPVSTEVPTVSTAVPPVTVTVPQVTTLAQEATTNPPPPNTSVASSGDVTPAPA